jgi:predicted DNA-binding transcriptional regulator AlpA
MIVANQPLGTLSPDLLTLKQAAALCGVSDRTLWTWATTGISPPALRIGRGVVRYSRPAYEAWIAGGCRPVREGQGNGLPVL